MQIAQHKQAQVIKRAMEALGAETEVTISTYLSACFVVCPDFHLGDHRIMAGKHL